MKSLIFLIFFSVNLFSQAVTRECTLEDNIEIPFLNGINNSEPEAIRSSVVIEEIFHEKIPTNDPTCFSVFYNQTTNVKVLEDLIESFGQKMRENVDEFSWGVV